MSLEKSIRNLIEGRENIQAVPRPDNKDRKEIQNVGRPDSAQPKSDKSTLTRTSEIKNKIIDEKEHSMSNLNTPSTQDLYKTVLSIIEAKKEPKESEKKDSEGKEVKLSKGKTEVDTEPETKSQAEVDKESEKEDEKAEKGDKKEAEKEGKKKKEMKEALKGGQKKLDVAEPKGKLTSADFKKLRKEEVEEIDEAEKSAQKTMDRHFSKQSKKMQDAINLHMRKGKSYWDASQAAKKHVKEDLDEARGVAAGAVDKHNCATHVYHEEFGEGKTIYSQHAEPDVEGNIAWYDVMFEHGIERQVSIDEMKIVASESHGNHKKMKKEDNVAEDAVASAQKAADQKMKAASITAKATVQADKIKDQARKQAKMNNSFEPEAVDPIIEAAKKALERISKNPAAPFNDAVKGVKGTDTRADSSD